MQPIRNLVKQQEEAIVRQMAPNKLLPELPQHSTLTPEERTLVTLKYKSKKIRQMNVQELDFCVPALLAKIHVVTGWVVPGGQLYGIMETEFRELLLEEFGDLNADEILHAFRTRADTVEDWGKNMNLGLINKILKPYLQDRYKASEIEREVAIKKNQDFNLRTSVDWRGQIEENYQHFIHGSRFFLKDLHPFAYDQLEEDGFIQPGMYKERFSWYQKRLLHDDYKLMTMAKSRCVLQLFRLARKRKFLSLYTK